MEINFSPLKSKTIFMKSLFAFFASFIRFFKNRKKNKVFTEINQKLEKKLKDREVDRIILKGEIIKMCRKFLNINARSRFIPKKNKNNTKIRKRVLAEYGERMEHLGIRINEDLELIS
jgi:hypothetical protein